MSRKEISPETKSDKKKSREEASFFESLVTGSAAGVGIAYSTFPAEGFKKHCQTRQVGGFKPYRGSLLFAVNIVPTTAIQWATDGVLRSYMPENAVFSQQLAASAFCGVTGALTATPVENSIIRQQMMKAGAKAAVADMMKQGVLRPWKTFGLVATRDAIFTMWMMSILPALKARTKEMDERTQLLANLTGSALGAAVSHPFDTVATNIQKSHDSARAAAMARELFLKEGMRAFYRGYPSRLFLFFAFSNGIPVFKQTADHCIYGRGELPESMKKVTNFAGSLFAKASRCIEAVACTSASKP